MAGLHPVKCMAKPAYDVKAKRAGEKMKYRIMFTFFTVAFVLVASSASANAGAMPNATRMFSPKEGSADYQSVMAMHKDAERADKQIEPYKIVLIKMAHTPSVSIAYVDARAIGDDLQVFQQVMIRKPGKSWQSVWVDASNGANECEVGIAHYTKITDYVRRNGLDSRALLPGFDERIENGRKGIECMFGDFEYDEEALKLPGKKPSDHSYSLIKTYTPKDGSEERTKILNAGANWDTPDPHYRPYMKVMALRAATMMDPQIWETEHWGIAFLKFQYDQFKGQPTGVGYVIVARDEAGAWSRKWSFDDGGSTSLCDAQLDHFNTARKMIAKHGLDPKKFAPEILMLEDEATQTMREYSGVCTGDF
jgi:hypothetical protein